MILPLVLKRYGKRAEGVWNDLFPVLKSLGFPGGFQHKHTQGSGIVQKKCGKAMADVRNNRLGYRKEQRGLASALFLVKCSIFTLGENLPIHG